LDLLSIFDKRPLRKRQGCYAYTPRWRNAGDRPSLSKNCTKNDDGRELNHTKKVVGFFNSFYERTVRKPNMMMIKSEYMKSKYKKY
jgi:hypothetical protein